MCRKPLLFVNRCIRWRFKVSCADCYFVYSFAYSHSGRQIDDYGEDEKVEHKGRERNREYAHLWFKFRLAWNWLWICFSANDIDDGECYCVAFILFVAHRFRKRRIGSATWTVRHCARESIDLNGLTWAEWVSVYTCIVIRMSVRRI